MLYKELNITICLIPVRFLSLLQLRKLIPTRRTLIKVLIILIVIFSISLPIVFYLEETPYGKYICNTCHSMNFYVVTMEKDPHGNYSCMICHERPPPAELFEMLLGELRRPEAVEIFEKYHPQTQKNLLEHCAKCHHKEDVEKLKIHIYHLTTVETLHTCSICHVPHIKEFLNKSCTQCHDYSATVEKHMYMHGSLTQRLISINCAQCHSPQSSAYVPPANVCLQATIEGESCLACHTQLRPPDITGRPCIACHKK